MSDEEPKNKGRDDSSSDSSSDDSDDNKAPKRTKKETEGNGKKQSDSDSSDTDRIDDRAASKRAASGDDDEDDSDDDFVGPSLSDAAPIKKKRVLEYESVYLDNLPCGMNYERSFMHRDVVTHVAVTPTDFVITASQDGHIKFWKKQEVSVEFVKHFRAHLGTINAIAVNATGALLATVASDKAVKVFDVVNFDMINMLKLDYIPSCASWIHKPGDAISELAVAEEDSTNIHVYDGKGSAEPLKTLKLHMKPVQVITYCPKFDIVISSDQGGMVEYWSGSGQDYGFPRSARFESKVDTDLYEFAKNKTYPLNMTVSPTGDMVVMMGEDRKIRMFRLLTGKMVFVIDESLGHYSELQQVKQVLPPMEFGKKISVEKDIARAGFAKYNNLVFDESGHFLLYSSLLGIKVVNIVTQKVSRLLGQREHLRTLGLALFQGRPKSTSCTSNTTEMEASDNPAFTDLGTDPTLVTTAYKKNRFYMFTNRSSKDLSSVDNDRDVFNEKPSKEDIISATEEKGAPRLYQNATIHTTVGDIHLDLFPRECPKTVENFCVHARNGYFNGHIFHRVIRQFMIQTGDPLGTGTGGESIWGGEFEDEFSPKLRHDRPYTLSMANAGPNTNGSQFFVTVVPTPWLDNKHTVFGRVCRGMEVVQNIGSLKSHPKTDKPYDEVSMVSISVRNPMLS
eukprot:GFUD01032277.1.p1 GENE.GFUD01032277.1~~GFUD01032277.1.p1  ORF type:complete len:679 (-),score=208.83 GFUD01032277.1:59-2095(-)